MNMRKIKNIIAIACTTFIVVCNLKYAHDGYGIRNTKPEERAYATTARPTYRHERHPYNIMCDAVVVYVYVKWPRSTHNPGNPFVTDSVTEMYTATGLSITEAKKNAELKAEEYKSLIPKCRVIIDNFYSIQKVQYPSYELRCESSGSMIDCQNETGDDCPLLKIS